MRNTYIVLIIIILVALAGFLFWKSNNVAPVGIPDYSTPTTDQNPFPTGTSSGSESVNPNANNPSVVNEPAPTPAPTPSPTPAVKSFTVIGKNYSFTPSTISVNKGDKVRITFQNQNGMHNLIIDEFNVGTKTIQGGTSDTIEFTADKTGSFQYYCSIGYHRAYGMWGTLTVK